MNKEQALARVNRYLQEASEASSDNLKYMYLGRAQGSLSVFYQMDVISFEDYEFFTDQLNALI
jgi:hypothetical protein